MDWSAEAIEQLKALWAEGHSTAEIGRRMGISKNAVVGKAHRLHLPARPSPIQREQAAAALRPVAAAPVTVVPAQPSQGVMERAVTSAPAPRPVAPVAPRAPAAVPTPPAMRAAPPVVRPFQRSGARNCCWPIGEPGTPEFRFCTSESFNGKPYCLEHSAIAYVKARDRREDAA